ncbi:hypothetical protein EA473_05160 [Natrarchaeobius chitinivorans]|uniref:Uncharacterized protein n=1 Tax=Natrarchaeobius chitinivorans TaxID=1679083 RepID=A0A3N6M3L5_NATCH|nr:hypothetical protein EA473_05160 [Natrarchaeobius chitinivorans]
MTRGDNYISYHQDPQSRRSEPHWVGVESAQSSGTTNRASTSIARLTHAFGSSRGHGNYGRGAAFWSAVSATLPP